MNETAMPRRRVEILDELRGLIVLLMIFYHAIYDLVFVFRAVDPALFQSRFMRWLQLFVACGFIVIAGIMCRYSRNNLRRGAKTFLAGMLVTAVTAAVIPSQLILFGILHFLGICMMLYPPAPPHCRYSGLPGTVRLYQQHRFRAVGLWQPDAGTAAPVPV